MPDKKSHDIIDLFDICIERIAAGETIDNILMDYPDAADDLRALLQTGQLVYQAQLTEIELNSTELNTVKSSTRQRLEDRLQKPKNNLVVMDKPKRRRKNTWWMSAAAGVAILIFGMVIGIIFTGETSQNLTLDVTRTAVADLNTTTRDEAIAIQSTAAAIAQLPMTATPVLVENATDVINAAANITATADINFTVTMDAEMILSLPAPQGQQTQVAFATQRAGSVATMTPAPSQTALPTQTMRPVGTMDMPMLVGTSTPHYGCPNGNCSDSDNIVMTSVASMNATLPPAQNASNVYLTATALAMLPQGTPNPRPAGESGTQVAALTTYEAPPLPTQNFNSVQLDPLRAGEIDDNAEWDRYTEYRRNYLSQFGNTVIDVDVRNRRIIQVVDSNGLPVQGATVRVTTRDRLISETRTYATGMTQFFPKLDAQSQGVDVFDVAIEYNSFRAFAELDLERPGDILTVRLDFEQSQPTQQLDVLFLIDTTSSMADEIAQLQNNITVIASQVDAIPGQPDVRYGLVAYRDRGDDYVTRVYPFTSNVNQFQQNLNALSANGGGNAPEALNEGLDDALTEMAWRDEQTTKLMFLVADAAPRMDYDDDVNYDVSAQAALATSIKIHTLASSGLSPAGEYIFRQLAQITMGRFLFLTYDNNQIAINAGSPSDTRTDLDVGDPEDSQGVGDYDVTRLDELVLRLITDELAALTTPVLSENRPATQLDTGTTELSDSDPFRLTATALVREATQTAIAEQNATSAPPSMGFDSFEITATAIVQDATRRAEQTLPEGEYLEGITANDLEAARRSVFYAGLFAGGSIIGVLALVWFVIYRYRRRHRKRG